MNASPVYILRWILATLVVLGAIHQCESISIKLTWSPPDTVHLLEGTNYSLIWEFTYSNHNNYRKEYSVVFYRRRSSWSGQGDEEQIAHKSFTSNSPVVYANDSFKSSYQVSLPATLRLINVQRGENYVYILKVVESTGNVLNKNKWYMKSEVTVEVYAIAYASSVSPTPSASVATQAPTKVGAQVPPQITIAPEREPQLTIGGSRTLICNASGDPHPSITWTKDGVPVDRFKRFGYFLRLNNVQIKDAGSYRCTASNGYDVTTVSIVGIKCPGALHCMKRKVGITIQSEDWKDAYANQASVEFKTLEFKLLSVIWSFYTKYSQKKLYKVDVDNFFRSHNIVFATVGFLFQEFTFDPLKLLQDQMSDGELGPFIVDRTLDLNPTNPPPVSPTKSANVATQDPPNARAHGSSGLTKSQKGGIIGGCFVLVLIIVILGFIYKKRKIIDLWSQMKHRHLPE